MWKQSRLLATEKSGRRTVFRREADGTLTTLHAFAGTDGQWPTAGLITGPDGALYGSAGLAVQNAATRQIPILTVANLKITASFLECGGLTWPDTAFSVSQHLHVRSRNSQVSARSKRCQATVLLTAGLPA